MSDIDTPDVPIMPAAQWLAHIAELERAGQTRLVARAMAQFRRYHGEPEASTFETRPTAVREQPGSA